MDIYRDFHISQLYFIYNYFIYLFSMCWNVCIFWLKQQGFVILTLFSKKTNQKTVGFLWISCPGKTEIVVFFALFRSVWLLLSVRSRKTSDFVAQPTGSDLQCNQNGASASVEGGSVFFFYPFSVSVSFFSNYQCVTSALKQILVLTVEDHHCQWTFPPGYSR